MIDPTCLYTEEEAMAALGLESLKAFAEFGGRPVGGRYRTHDEAGDYYLGLDLIAAVYRSRGEEPPEFASVVRARDKRQKPAEPSAATTSQTVHPAQTYSVTEIAKLLQKADHHVLGLIHSGELIAFNTASKMAARPRWRITNEEFQSFIQRRSTQPKIPTQRRRRVIPQRY